MRQEDEPGYVKEIWQPNWNCFCCHDTGIIKPKLVTLVIDGYNPKRDKMPRCIKPGCEAGETWDSTHVADCVDYRISATTCQELDAIERESWKQATRDKFELICTRMKSAAVGMSLRKRDRTPHEEELAHRQHQEALNR